MPTSTESTASAPTATRKERPGTEVVLAFFFGPGADFVARALVPLGISPLALVAANAVVGFAAAVAVAAGLFLQGALLLQVKTLLDNADGRLARRSARASLVGRYLDTEADLAVNAAVFAALGYATGAWALAVAAFVALTLVLSANFNFVELHRAAHGGAALRLPRSGGRIERALERVYGLLFEPQDRVLRRFSSSRLARLLGGGAAGGRAYSVAAYYDRGTANVLANLGLSTQLAALGLCLVAGVPELYLWIAAGSLTLLPLLQLRREWLVRRSLSALRAG